MDGILKSKLTLLADNLSEEGFEEIFLNNLSEQDFLDYEKLLSDEISKAEGVEFQRLIQLRHLFRIVLKFHTDLHRGINRLREYTL